jgi:hypothetical protein
LPEESTHSQLPLLAEPERKMPCVPEVLSQRISSASVQGSPEANVMGLSSAVSNSLAAALAPIS